MDRPPLSVLAFPFRRLAPLYSVLCLFRHPEVWPRDLREAVNLLILPFPRIAYLEQGIALLSPRLPNIHVVNTPSSGSISSRTRFLPLRETPLDAYSLCFPWSLEVNAGGRMSKPHNETLLSE